MMSGIFLASIGGNLIKLRQAALSRDGDHHPVAAHAVARQELFQSLANQLDRIGFRLTENLRIFDVVEGVGGDVFGVVAGAHSQRFSAH